jgi:hypothetical protein
MRKLVAIKATWNWLRKNSFHSSAGWQCTAYSFPTARRCVRPVDQIQYRVHHDSALLVTARHNTITAYPKEETMAATPYFQFINSTPLIQPGGMVCFLLYQSPLQYVMPFMTFAEAVQILDFLVTLHIDEIPEPLHINTVAGTLDLSADVETFTASASALDAFSVVATFNREQSYMMVQALIWSLYVLPGAGDIDLERLPESREKEQLIAMRRRLVGQQ